MKLFSTNTCYVPKDLSSITQRKNEVSPELGGMTQQQIEKIWQSIENLYQTGNHPLITMCLRRKGEIILNRSLGYAQVILPMVWLQMQCLPIQTPRFAYFQHQK